MGMARNAGSGNGTAKAKQRQRSLDRQGLSFWAIAGHHSWRKGHGGGNKVGAITHAPKEWGSKARKVEEHDTMLAKQAEMDAIAEGLDAWEDFGSYRDDYLDEMDAELLNDALASDLTNVSFNGQPLESFDYDYCTCCGRPY